MLAAQNRLVELHLVHTIVHHSFQIVHFNDLVPQIGKHTQCEITVRDCGAEGTFRLGLFLVHMNPLVVQCGIGKLADSLLCELYIITCA